MTHEYQAHSNLVIPWVKNGRFWQTICKPTLLNLEIMAFFSPWSLWKWFCFYHPPLWLGFNFVLVFQINIWISSKIWLTLENKDDCWYYMLYWKFIISYQTEYVSVKLNYIVKEVCLQRLDLTDIGCCMYFLKEMVNFK